MSSTPDTFKKFEDKRRQEREVAEQNVLFREVDEDLRRDQLTRLWKRYGVLLICAAVALVLGVAGYEIYKAHQASERADQAALLDQADAAIAANDQARADELLARLEKDGNPGYRTLARLRHASVLIEQKKIPEARAELDKVSADADALPAYRNLAVILDALAGLDTEDPKTIEAKLEPLTIAGNPWRHAALEVSALAIAKQGDPARAVKALDGILDDPDTTPDRRALTQSLRTVFAHDAGETAPAPAAPASQPAAK